MLAQLFPERVFEERDEGDNIYTIAVSIYEANHVSWFNLQTRVCVQLGKTKKYTKVKESSDRPFYNESFTFNFDGKLERMMDMILTITGELINLNQYPYAGRPARFSFVVHNYSLMWQLTERALRVSDPPNESNDEEGEQRGAVSYVIIAALKTFDRYRNIGVESTGTELLEAQGLILVLYGFNQVEGRKEKLGGYMELHLLKVGQQPIKNTRHYMMMVSNSFASQLLSKAVYFQGHEISDKWILLTHPSDPAGHIRGYINCEISIMPQGEKPRLRRFHEPSGYFIPENLGGGKLKARYTFRIHRGTNIYIPDIKGFAVYVRVFFAGLSGETTKRKDTRFPHWTEEIVFTELFPPMYNRFRIDVHFGKKEICTKYLNLSRISDPAVKGFLPTYGPSFLHLYNPPYRYLGSLLVSLETKTVHAFSESEKLLGVKRQKTQEIIEKMFWEYEDFALFGVIYEVSMLRKPPPVTESDVQIVLGFSTSDERPYNEGNQYHSRKNSLVQMDGSYYCIPKTEEKSTVFTTEKLPDNRHRVFVSNRLFHISQKLGENLAQIHFELDHSPENAKIHLLESLQNTIKRCQQFKSTAVPGPTSLEKERLKTVIAKVNKIIKEMTKIKPDGIVTSMFEKSLELCHDLFSLAKDPQESFPQIILIVKNNEGILAYSQINPRTVLFSLKENEKGINCGVVQSLFLKGVNRKLEETFGGKMDILLWLGPVKSIGHGIESIPSGFQDLSHDFSFPSSIKYSQVHDFTCRAHLYQGHFLPCDDHSGTCSMVMTVYFDCKSASSSIKEYLSPLWLETLVIKNAKLFGNIQDIKKNPPSLVIEMWNIGKPSILLGRHLVTPHVFLEEDRLQPPVYPPKPDWLTIHSNGNVRGEILTMFEIIQVRGESDREGETEVTKIPDYIRLPTDRYKLEILFWGVRRSMSWSLHDLNVPSVSINCGHIQVTSNQLRNPSSFPNFNQPLFIFDLDLPEDWHYAPPVIIRLYDNRMFGTQVFVGSHIVRNLKQFLVELPSKDELGESRRTRALTVTGSLAFSEAYARKLQQSAELRSDFESKTPLIYLKEDVKSKTPLMRHLEEKRSRWWTYICWCWRKKKEEPGYISLGLVCPFNDPDSDEEFYDWWTKYFDSLPRHMYSDTKDENISSNVRETNLKIDLELAWFARKTPGIKIYPNELENQPEFEGFEDIIRTFTLTKDSHKRSNDCGKFKGCLALYKDTRDLMTLDGFSVEEGMYSSVERELGAVVPLTVRVYVIRAHQLHSNEKMKKVNAFIEVTVPSRNQVISDSKHFIRQECNPIFGKYYELEVRLPHDSTLVVRVMDKKRIKDKELIGETYIDIENRYYSRHRGTCGLQRAYATEGYNTWRDVHKPSEILDWTCMSHNLPLPIYGIDTVIVGGLKFTSDRRDYKDPKESLALKALLNWDKVPALGCKLVEEHVETRSLYIPQQPGVEKGKLEMWVDIFPGQIDLPPPVNVKPRTPERYELRAVVWSTRNVRLIDDGALVGKKNTDIFVKGWLKGKSDVQKTDVHYASLTGEGLFNWRFVFDFSYDRQEQMIVLDDFSNKIPPILHMQVWDQERIHYNQYIGSLSLDIRDVPPPSKRLPITKSYMPIKGWNRNLFRDRYARGWWPFIGEDKGRLKTVGMVDLELILLTSMEAERSPAGRGRNDPDALPDPVRPIMQYTIWIVPFRAIKNYLWRYHKGAMFKVLLAIVIGFFIMVIFYSIPNYSVKKIMGA